MPPEKALAYLAGGNNRSIPDCVLVVTVMRISIVIAYRI